MIDMETSKPLDKALNFNPENLFEYLEFLLHNVNAEIISSGAETIKETLCEYIEALPLPDPRSARLEIEDKVTQALCESSHSAYKAGFIEACRLFKTIYSF